MRKKYREVVESTRFTKERDALNSDIKRMDEILQGVVFFVSHSPQLGKDLGNGKIWAIPTNPWNTIPLVVYYSFTEQEVILESIIKASDQED